MEHRRYRRCRPRRTRVARCHPHVTEAIGAAGPVRPLRVIVTKRVAALLLERVVDRLGAGLRPFRPRRGLAAQAQPRPAESNVSRESSFQGGGPDVWAERPRADCPSTLSYPGLEFNSQPAALRPCRAGSAARAGGWYGNPHFSSPREFFSRRVSGVSGRSPSDITSPGTRHDIHTSVLSRHLWAAAEHKD